MNEASLTLTVTIDACGCADEAWPRLPRDTMATSTEAMVAQVGPLWTVDKYPLLEPSATTPPPGWRLLVDENLPHPVKDRRV